MDKQTKNKKIEIRYFILLISEIAILIILLGVFVKSINGGIGIPMLL